MSRLTELYKSAKAGKQLQCLSSDGKWHNIDLDGLEHLAEKYYRIEPESVEVHLYPNEYSVKTITVNLEDLE